MEQQKILWVLLSVLAVLMVVVMAGVFVFYPGSGVSPEMAGGGMASGDLTPRDEQLFDPIRYIKEQEEAPGLEIPKEDVFAEEDYYIVTVVEEAGNNDDSAMSAEPTSVGIRPAAGDLKERVVTAPAAPRIQEPVSRTVQAPAAPATRAPEPEKTERVLSYWIQVGSFGSRTTATGVKDELKDQGFSSTITTLEDNGKVYYRVRIGAYNTKAEAERFCQDIKALRGFQGSYVSAVWSTRTVGGTQAAAID